MTKTKTSRGIAALAVLPFVLLAACSGQGGPPADGKLTIAVAVEPVSLDPCDTQDAANAVVLRTNVTEALTRIDPDTGAVAPFLAESWQQVDERTWRFSLRSGVRFHDGTPFDATAAATSINRVVDPELNCQNLDQFPYPITRPRSTPARSRSSRNRPTRSSRCGSATPTSAPPPPRPPRRRAPRSAPAPTGSPSGCRASR
ncbi:hypothetical protein BJF90_24175 [Pseudonocardia sp. CNS-004]|nr:hypothetical protein BJF90_24175 [Pseudonocardia sp. CNS-004]